ncbi:BQ5605_C105g13174 [Microbotryum silenes-dioicae]|uniref:BQ5605_C105g13174 protein n=1 Tax=Microbotryum silenes-dioicae TaxID=796604 RepID=A0A2X0PJ95_9BASI|nr:BQ5605_C105g13174 [Microbotryum silenes-dioicae]
MGCLSGCSPCRPSRACRSGWPVVAAPTLVPPIDFWARAVVEITQGVGGGFLCFVK